MINLNITLKMEMNFSLTQPEMSFHGYELNINEIFDRRTEWHKI